MKILRFLLFSSFFATSCNIQKIKGVNQEENSSKKEQKVVTTSNEEPSSSSSGGGSSSSSGGSSSGGGSSSSSDSSSSGGSSSGGGSSSSSGGSSESSSSSSSESSSSSGGDSVTTRGETPDPSVDPAPKDGSSPKVKPSADEEPKKPSDVAPELTLDEEVDLSATTFKDDALKTPLFKLEYDDSEIDKEDQRSVDDKKTILETMYDQFLKNAIYGNEVYTLDKVVFVEKKDTSSVLRGIYYPHSNYIKVELPSNHKNLNHLFSIFLHEYYHHLTIPKVDKSLESYIPSGNRNDKANVDNYYYQQYMNIFNNGIRQINRNVRNIDHLFSVQTRSGRRLSDARHKTRITRNTLRYQTFNWETQLYNLYHFRNNASRLIYWRGAPPYASGIRDGKILEPDVYFLESSEILARWTSMMTNTFWPKNADGIPHISMGRRLFDYLQTMFIRTNIYYHYNQLQRPYPSVLTYWYDSLNKRLRYDVRSRHRLPWSQIKGFKNQTKEKMEEKWLEWKNYFKNIFFNQDQLLSSAIKDKDDNLYLELNAKDKTITFEDTTSGDVLNAPVKKLKKVGQLTFNTKPYDANNQKKEKLINNYLYKINKANLPKGIYYIKINGAYQTSGFELDNLSNKVRVVWDFNSSNWASSLYKFYKKRVGGEGSEERIVLEVI